MLYKNTTIDEINKLKDELRKRANNNALHSSEVVKLSQKIDMLINKIMKEEVMLKS